MLFPTYDFEDLKLRITFEQMALSYVVPVALEHSGRKWERVTNKYSFESEDMRTFVRWTPEQRKAFARKAAERWYAYRDDEGFTV